MSKNDLTVPAADSGSDRVSLLIVFLLYGALWAVYPHKFVASDEWSYSQLAFEALRGGFFRHPSDFVFAHRLLVYLPVSFLYTLFGINIYTTNLWPFCGGLLILFTIWAALPTGRSKRFGLLLGMACVPLFTSSVSLLPDVFVAGLLGSSALLLHRRRNGGRGGIRGLLYPTGAVGLLFLAFLAKESAYWLLPFWLLVLITDLRRGDSGLVRRFHVPAAVMAGMLGLLYLIFCWKVWGSPLARFNSVQELTGHHLWSLEHASGWALIKRVTVSRVSMFLRDYGPLVLLTAASIRTIPRSLRFWACYTVIMVLFFWFGSSSFTRYEPLPSTARMTLPALPGFCILAGHFASRLSLSSEGAQRGARTHDRLVFLTVASLAVLPFVDYVKSWRYESRPEMHVMEMVRREIAEAPTGRTLIVCSDMRSPESLAFYFGYRYPSNVAAVYAGKLNREDLLRSEKVFVFLDAGRSKFLEGAYGQPNFDQQIRELGLPALYEKEGVRLYRPARVEDLLALCGS